MAHDISGHRPRLPIPQPEKLGLTETGSILQVGRGHGSAHAKLILIGEHSVVHGRTAVAMPLPRLRVQAVAELQDCAQWLETEEFAGPLSQAPARVHSLVEAVRATLAHFGKPDLGLKIEVRSGIPAGRGLGSSAAATHAMIEAIRSLLHGELNEDQRYDLVQLAERIAHGNPSGLDARATRVEQAISFRAGEFQTIPVRTPGVLVLVDTGIRGSTKVAVDKVAAFIDRIPSRGQQLLDELDHLAGRAIADLSDGDAAGLGRCMNSAQEILAEFGVSDDSIDSLADAALKAGALGAKLTGGGLGGCVLALAPDVDVADRVISAMEDAGAVSCWSVAMGDSPTLPATAG